MIALITKDSSAFSKMSGLMVFVVTKTQQRGHISVILRKISFIVQQKRPFPMKSSAILSAQHLKVIVVQATKTT
jgi:hypothetical protein